MKELITEFILLLISIIIIILIEKRMLNKNKNPLYIDVFASKISTIIIFIIIYLLLRITCLLIL